MIKTEYYTELVKALGSFKDRPLMIRAKQAIEELLVLHQLDQSEIVRLRRMVEMKEDEKWKDLKAGNRSPYVKDN